MFPCIWSRIKSDFTVATINICFMLHSSLQLYRVYNHLAIDKGDWVTNNTTSESERSVVLESDNLQARQLEYFCYTISADNN